MIIIYIWTSERYLDNSEFWPIRICYPSQVEFFNLFHFSGFCWVVTQKQFFRRGCTVYVAFKIKTFYNLCFVGGYELVKADSECWPTKQYGLASITKPSMKGKKGFPQNDGECGHKARQMGVKLFLTCHNVRGFYCYVYSPKAKAYLTDTCEMKHNTGKCNIYRVTKEGKKDTSSIKNLPFTDAIIVFYVFSYF